MGLLATRSTLIPETGESDPCPSSWYLFSRPSTALRLVPLYATAAQDAHFGGKMETPLKVLKSRHFSNERRSSYLPLMQGLTQQEREHELIEFWLKSKRYIALIGMLREGVRPELHVLLAALSGCGVSRAVHTAMQIHCFVLKVGLGTNVLVGSCLVSVYAKCGVLEVAELVFDEMPIKNVVSWTGLIAGFVQHSQVEACFGLFSRMRGAADVDPNEFTFSIVLSGCTSSGFFGMGISVHCLVVKMGFTSFIHVSNALVSLYAKYGLIEEASCVFQRMKWKDKVSWNSMIVGCAHHGLAEKAIELFNDMERNGVVPDAISFLGILSSCRHAGLLEQGQFYFNLMAEQGVEPELDHYSCMVDLYGRCGRLDDAWSLIKYMPMRPNSVIWGSLLYSCRLFGEVGGIHAAENRLLLEPDCSTTHVQLISLYASVGCWDPVARVRKLLKCNGLKLNAGSSWIEIGNDVHQFRAENSTGDNSRNEGLAVIDTLARHMKSLGNEPTFDTI